MAFSEYLSERVRNSLKDNKASFEGKKMFGGMVFLVDDKMCVGIVKDDLMVRIAPEDQDKFLQEEGCRMMDFTKRPMKGYLYISPEGVDMGEDLDKWVKRCLEFNPKAKSSKKKK